MAASASDAHPFPIYNARYRFLLPILDADGDLVTGASSLDTELSQDCGTFADATNEATEIATSSGMYYVDLIATELDTKSTAVIVKTATVGAKTTPVLLYPVRLPVIRTGTAQAGGASSITLDSGASAIDDYYTGCYVNITNNSPSNALGQARLITAYVGSTKVATVEGTYGTNPSSASTFEILGTDTWIYRLGDVRAFAGIAGTSASGIPEVKVASIAASAITATSIASDAITDAKVASDVTIASVTGAVGSVTGAVGSVASGGITAASFAANAINASKVDPDVTTELQAGLATAAALAVVDGIVDDILLDTAEIGTAGAGLTNIDLPNQTMNITGNITGNLTGSVGSVTAGVTLAASAVQAIWDALTSALTTVGSIGKLLVDNINATISSRLASASYTAPPTAAANADAVWDETLADHLTAGSTGNALNAAGAAGDPWSTALPGAYGAGTAGKIIGDNVNATVSSRATPAQVTAVVDTVIADAALATAANLATVAGFLDTEIAAILADTNELQTDWANGGRLDTILDARASQTSVDDVPTNIPTAIQNADALLKRDMSAVTGESARSALNALRFLRNKWSITGGTLTVTKEDDTATAWTGAVTQTAGDPVSQIDPG